MYQHDIERPATRYLVQDEDQDRHADSSRAWVSYLFLGAATALLALMLFAAAVGTVRPYEVPASTTTAPK